MRGIQIIFQKEMKRVFKDKKMVVSLFILPVILMVVLLFCIWPAPPLGEVGGGYSCLIFFTGFSPAAIQLCTATAAKLISRTITPATIIHGHQVMR